MNRRSLRFGAITSLVVTTVVVGLSLLVPSLTEEAPEPGVVELDPLAPFAGEVVLQVGAVVLFAALVLVVAALIHSRRTSRHTD